MKPDPPENVVAQPVTSNPRRLEVTWQTPSTWPDPESFPLKFFLRYRPLILDQWQHVSARPCPARTRVPAAPPQGAGGACGPTGRCSGAKPAGSRRGFRRGEGSRQAWEGGAEGGVLI